MYQTIKYWRNPILELAGLRGPISCTSVVRGPLYNTLAHVEYSLLYFIYFNWHNCKCGLNFSHFLLNLIKFRVQSLFGDIYWFLKNVSRYNIFFKWIAIYRYFDIIAQPYKLYNTDTGNSQNSWLKGIFWYFLWHSIWEKND